MSIENPNLTPDSTQSRTLWFAVLGVAVLAVGGYAIYQNTQINDLRRDLASYHEDLSSLRGNLSNTSTELKGELHKEFSDLKDELTTTRQASSRAISATQKSAMKNTEEVAARLEKSQADRAAALGSEISQVRAATVETSTQLQGVNGEVKAVKGDVATTREELAKAVANLTSVKGDLGVMSGHIATNAKEIEWLRQLGERNIFEFTITRKAGQQRIGDITLALNKANVKRGSYSVTVNADDRNIEKRDKTINEPVQFYVPSKAKQPYEVVVNSVGKDTIKGYLSTPKVTTARN
jgi:chromosome segregation ATPase